MGHTHRYKFGFKKKKIQVKSPSPESRTPNSVRIRQSGRAGKRGVTRTRVTIEFFYVVTEGVRYKSFLCCDIRFYVTTGNGHSKGFVVMTELATTEALYYP